MSGRRNERKRKKGKEGIKWKGWIKIRIRRLGLGEIGISRKKKRKEDRTVKTWKKLRKIAGEIIWKIQQR